MPETSKFMKIAVLIFSVVLVAVAVIGTVESAESNRLYLPVNGSVGNMSIGWHYPDYGDLVAESDLIIVATVSDKFGIWNTADGKKPPRYALCDYGISTCHPCEEFEVLKGDVARVCLRAPGGTVDGYTMNAAPVPSLEIGDTVLVFLTHNYDENDVYLSWYHIGSPNVFTETENGTFVNEYYGELTVEQLKKDIENSNENLEDAESASSLKFLPLATCITIG